MNILGINGLGTAPSACLVHDGQLIAMAEEEKLNRQKGSFGLMPVKAAKFCLDFKNLKLSDIDYIAFGWDANRYRLYMPYFFLYTYIRHAPKFQRASNIFKSIEQILKYHPGNVRYMIEEMFRASGLMGDIPPIVFVPHHIAHAACSFYASGFDDAYILVIDGSGEDKCTTIARGEGSAIYDVRDFKIPDSLGWFYQSITEFLGFIPNRHEGKVMALASYGHEDKVVSGKIDKMISLGHNGAYTYAAKYSFLGTHSSGRIYSDETARLLGRARGHSEPILGLHKNIAYHTQKTLEGIARGLVNSTVSRPDYKGRLCVSGGVGLNCKMNGVIAEMDCVDEIFVSPFPNDAGAALGAALYVSQKQGFDPRSKMEHSYWGPSFNCQEVEKALIRYGVKFRKEPEIERTTADLIFKDKVVGWFQGRMETGPRALGNRSILANPLNNQMSDHVNKKVKNRESWRPFAPSILHEERQRYIINSREAPFMAISFNVSEQIKQQIPAVVHIDNTTRPHLVKKDVNPRYWNMINEFRKKSGIAAVLNTSFNSNEEPIVCTPEDALRTFYASGMDYLAIEDFLVYK
jgi:carbamoyltransferase